MHQVFWKGLIFGLGLAVASAVAYGAYRFASGFSLRPAAVESVSPSQALQIEQAERDFSDLSIEERIAKSSVIFAARFEGAEDGRLRAVVSEILKKDEGVASPVGVGDEYPRASIYPQEGVDYGTGVVVFLTGSNASFTSSVSVRSDLVFGLGNMPLELLRKKCSSGA